MRTLQRLNIRPARAVRFLNSPQWSIGLETDIIVLDCGYDGGMVPGGRSAAGAPLAIRRASQIFAGNSLAEGKIGWYDYAQTKMLLQNVSIHDAGSFMIDPVNPEFSLNKLPETLETMFAHCSLVLLIGGDHSISYWTAQAFKSENSTLIFFDAHEDATDIVSTYPHSGNVVSHLDQKMWHDNIIQIGLRGIVPNKRREPPDSRKVYSNVNKIENSVRTNAESYHVSIDVDVLDPSYVRAVAAPSPNGMSPDQLTQSVRNFTHSHGKTKLLEIVEFAPQTQEDPTQAFLISQIIVRMLNDLVDVK